jgi:glycosyl transferase family 25
MRTRLFVVSLQSAHERHAFMSRQLRKNNLDYEFVDATDAIALAPEYVAEVNSQREYANPLRSGEIACVLSHRKACLQLVASGSDFGIIMEDDVIIGSKFGELTQRVAAHDAKGQVVLFYAPAHGSVRLTALASLGGGFCLASGEPANKVFGAQAYFLSAATARDLAGGMDPVRSIADDWKRYTEKGFIRSVALVYPFPVLHAEFLSTVNRSPDQSSARTRIKNFMYRNRVFPFYQLFLMAVDSSLSADSEARSRPHSVLLARPTDFRNCLYATRPRDRTLRRCSSALLNALVGHSFSILSHTEDLPVAIGLDADRDEHRDVAYLARPARLLDDPVEVDVWELTLDRPVPTGLDVPVDLLVEPADRPPARPGAPQGFRDVPDPTRAHSR